MTAAERSAANTDAIARELLGLLGSGRQVTPFASRPGGLDVADAYAVVAKLRDLRKARGETPVGRKIGFTNRSMWTTYGVNGPIWNYMYDKTVHDLPAGGGDFALAGLAQPLIEPEIALHLARAPQSGMNDAELLGCIDWIAHGFEVVQSVYPNWSFTATDAIAGYGMHAAYLIGERHTITDDLARWDKALGTFTLQLKRNDGLSREGRAQNVLDGPLPALRFLIDEIARHPGSEPLAAGEIITTGTLTDAMPIAAGETWSTTLAGIDVQGLRLTLR
ncbi:hydratase [Bradyrhizobium prioriisuperbiae]|uniref:2-keto-4-pentenoate hydratase n=1 Tax=Bradyrhizobium prioriisuperbiae TaxID=2854389 RepID=UPI0028E7147B|nr:hydratase [Bradyrhizobium prioritasuperba]